MTKSNSTTKADDQPKTHARPMSPAFKVAWIVQMLFGIGAVVYLGGCAALMMPDALPNSVQDLTILFLAVDLFLMALGGLVWYLAWRARQIQKIEGETRKAWLNLSPTILALIGVLATLIWLLWTEVLDPCEPYTAAEIRAVFPDQPEDYGSWYSHSRTFNFRCYNLPSPK